MELMSSGERGLPSSAPLLTPRFEQALRYAALGHQGQVRRTGELPYFEHVVAVAWILDRAGFDEDIVIAGLLHDLVEDTPTTPQDIETRFGRAVADLVGYCSEQKTDAAGRKRPWIDRKRDHLACMASAPVEARAVILADKLHNLMSIEIDLREGRPVWSQFHADRASVLSYYRQAIELCTAGDPRLAPLASKARETLNAVDLLGE
jgi:guanosine-3',5'-bis(diphosphate) 3'-pyrophosphohydrolase